MPKLADLLEKEGQYIDALQQYCAAAEIQRNEATGSHCQAAQQRLKAHIEYLKTSGNTGEAVELELRLESTLSAIKTSEAEWQDSVDAGIKAFTQGHYDQAETLLQRAVELAERLQPRDYRLVRTLGQLGRIYSSQRKFSEAATEFRQQLAVTEEVYGPQSPENSNPLERLGSDALGEHDYPSAVGFYSRALELNEKTYGKNSARIISDLDLIGGAYESQGGIRPSGTLLSAGVGRG